MPLFVLIRILRGERLRKATPAESQQLSGLLAVIAIYFALALAFIKYEKQFVSSASPQAIWGFDTIVISVAFFISFFWGKYVPAKVSYTLAAILWPLLFILALTGHIGR
jgi:hypothetical protein